MYGGEVATLPVTRHNRSMKVKELSEYLSRLDPEAHVCALVYDKAQFDFPDDDEMVLTNEGWEKLCNDFDEQSWNDIWQSLHMGALDYAEERES